MLKILPDNGCRETQVKRQADRRRQTDRQAHRQTWTGEQTETRWRTGRQAGGQTDKLTDRHIHKHGQASRQRQAGGQTDKLADKMTDTLSW